MTKHPDKNFDFSRPEDQERFKKLPTTEKNELIGQAEEEAYKIDADIREYMEKIRNHERSHDYSQIVEG